MTLKDLFGVRNLDAVADKRGAPPDLAAVATVCAEMLQAALPAFPSGTSFALIELLQFGQGGRQSCTTVYSALPESSVEEVVGRHYAIISELKQLPGMNWSLMSSDVIQFGDEILFCSLPGNSGKIAASASGHWSKPVLRNLPEGYAPDATPGFLEVRQKCGAYLERLVPGLPPANAAGVLVVPFSVPATATKLGAAFILVAGDRELSAETVYDLYRKFQLFWLRFNPVGKQVASAQ